MSNSRVTFNTDSIQFEDLNGVRNSKIESQVIDEIIFSGATDGDKIILANVKDPINDNDAANKKYVDDNIVTDNTVLRTFGNQEKSGTLKITDSSESSSSVNGCLVLSGGLGVARNVNISGTTRSNVFVTTSDSNLKENIEDLESPISKINRIRVVTYNLKNDEHKRKKYGVLAQNLIENGFQDFVYSEKDQLSVDYNNFIALLIKSVQNLSEEVTNLKKRI